MAKVKTSVSDKIKTALAMPANTHGFKMHVVELLETPQVDGVEIVAWQIINFRFDNYIIVGGDVINYHYSGKSAAESMKLAKALNPQSSYRISRYNMPQDVADRIASDMVWEAREVARFADGTYKPLPWSDEPWFKDAHEAFKHFAHVSTGRDGLIAYTENSSKGAADLQLRLSPGRYLQEFYQHKLNELKPFDTGATNVHRDRVYRTPLEHYCFIYSSAFGDNSELCFAATPDEITEVYHNGPESCMSKFFDDLPCHPTSIYGAGDLKLAYLKETDGDITARALVWPDKLVTGRAYGHVSMLLLKLQALGYEIDQNNWDSLRGARLLKVPYEDGYVMPYIDGIDYHTYGNHDDGLHFKIGGAYDACFQNGLNYDPELQDDRPTCDRCDGALEEEDAHIINSINRNNLRIESYWCHGCTENHTFECASSGNTYSNGTPSTEVEHYGTVANRHLGDGFFECSVSGNWFHNNNLAGTYMGEDDPVSVDAVRDDGLVKCDNGYYWQVDEVPGQELEPKLPLDLHRQDAPAALPKWFVRDGGYREDLGHETSFEVTIDNGPSYYYSKQEDALQAIENLNTNFGLRVA